jgi:hypothetical protein
MQDLEAQIRNLEITVSSKDTELHQITATLDQDHKEHLLQAQLTYEKKILQNQEKYIRLQNRHKSQEREFEKYLSRRKRETRKLRASFTNSPLRLSQRKKLPLPFGEKQRKAKKRGSSSSA